VASRIEGLNPKSVWHHFEAISRIPRGSGNEAAVGNYILSLAKKNKLESQKDELGNIIVRKPATAGKEKNTGVVLQGHMDMVCEKNNDTVHDFLKDPITLVKDGQWVKANGTTLGADNGIGVCYALAVMDDASLVHPPLEFLFTVDEETGLTGANGLKSDFVKGKILINLDSEEEGAFYIGCAGGQHTILRHKISWQKAKAGSKTLIIKVGGLRGGHSGLNIHEGYGNSIKLLARFLYNLNNSVKFDLVSLNGGNKHNAIPREAEAAITVNNQDSPLIRQRAAEANHIFKNELQFSDKGVFIEISETKPAAQVMSQDLGNALIRLLYVMPHGVMEMSHAVKGLVETSTNMAIAQTTESGIQLLTSQRSSVASAIIDIAGKVKAVGELAGFGVEQGGGYPAWTPNPDSALLKFSTEAYKDITGRKAEVKAIHAGLECGIIGEKYDGMDMISFGPTIEGAHSPNERVKISSVENCWNFLVALLKRI
jgi:dipeptidase D